MQIKFIDAAQLADLLRFTEPLKTIDYEGQQVYVLHRFGVDILAIVNPLTGGAACIYPPGAFEGGSIHDEARQAADIASINAFFGFKD